jgi:lipopolysaccharide assembly outer membrane protein LptD (OstA)
LESAPPAKSPRLGAAERQRLIDDFKSGKVSSEYDIMTTKVEGKYVVRSRKQKLSDEQVQKITPSKPTVNETQATILPSIQAKKVDKAQVLELQVQLNSQMLQEMKQLKKKIKKLKRSIFSDDEPAPPENDETVQPID